MENKDDEKIHYVCNSMKLLMCNSVRVEFFKAHCYICVRHTKKEIEIRQI